MVKLGGIFLARARVSIRWLAGAGKSGHNNNVRNCMRVRSSPLSRTKLYFLGNEFNLLLVPVPLELERI